VKAKMEVSLIARTQLAVGIADVQPGDLEDAETAETAHPDLLHEFAGRACYQSFHKPNPATASNEDYLANIIRCGHFSVLEHASFSFYVTGVSRSLLLELERHRNLSFSVLSQRYVSPAKYGLSYVEPPAFKRSPSALRLQSLQAEQWLDAVARYDECFHILRAEGADYKQAREAARAFLPGAAETRFVVTGNVTHWRHILRLRTAPGADAEIQAFANLVREHLEREAPASMQD
jgi:thymidylate synthase (FAD)